MSEDDWFTQEMGKVQPLNKEKSRVLVTKPKRKHEILRNLEDKELNHIQTLKNDSLSAKRTDTWLLRADGVASKELNTLAKTNIKHELDLHGLTQDEAIKELEKYVSEALSHNVRQINIVHGKGNHSKGKSVLKDITYQWLEHGALASFILAAVPAQQSKGGACNVLLRKQKS